MFEFGVVADKNPQVFVAPHLGHCSDPHIDGNFYVILIAALKSVWNLPAKASMVGILFEGFKLFLGYPLVLRGKLAEGLFECLRSP